MGYILWEWEGSYIFVYRSFGLKSFKLGIKGWKKIIKKFMRMVESYDKKNKIVNIYGDVFISFIIG